MNVNQNRHTMCPSMIDDLMKAHAEAKQSAVESGVSGSKCTMDAKCPFCGVTVEFAESMLRDGIKCPGCGKLFSSSASDVLTTNPNRHNK